MRLNTRPVLAGVAMGTIALIALVLLPKTAIESLGARTHLANIMDAAKPPLGTKARFLIGLIPFFFASAVGLILGFVLARKPKIDEYGDYPDYELGEPPSADPFAPMSFTAPAPVAPEMAPAPVAPIAVADLSPPPAPALTPPPAPVSPIEAERNSDLAEIADAIVRLGARLDTIETRLEAAPKSPAAKAGGAIADRIAKITEALDAAG